MRNPYELTATVGFAGGETIQFAEREATGAIGAGVAISVQAFELVEPHLVIVAPTWTVAHRYGVFDLDATALKGLASRLLDEAAILRTRDGATVEASLLVSLSVWLDSRANTASVSVFGI